jgi:hypothetical protein
MGLIVPPAERSLPAPAGSAIISAYSISPEGVGRNNMIDMAVPKNGHSEAI